MKNKITRAQNFADWYTNVINDAKLITYSDIKGCINYLPNGWSIWTNIQNLLDKEFKKINVQNVQLPPFIRLSDFTLEKKHIEGFAPEAFIIDRKGEEKLTDPYILRPTSEVLFSKLFNDVVKTYNDLPLLYNQWCPAYRAEKTTKPFLRGCQFHWHEMHCLFTTKNDGLKFTKKILKIYKNFLEKVFNIAVLSGEKTIGERFAGAENTYTVEVWSQDNQSIQVATSHYLGQNFCKIYGVTFQNKDNKIDIPYYTSHGTSTRLIGGMIVNHGDDKGLVLPFLLAPTQINIITLLANKDPNVLTIAKKIAKQLKKYRVKIDSSDESFGYKISESEINGIPFSIVIGPKDIQNNTCVLIKRNSGEKMNINLNELQKTIKQEIKKYGEELYNSSLAKLNSSIVEISTIEEFEDKIKQNIVLAPWAGSEQDEKTIKEKYNVSPRVIKCSCTDKTCFLTKKKSKYLVYFARAY